MRQFRLERMAFLLVVVSSWRGGKIAGSGEDMQFWRMEIEIIESGRNKRRVKANDGTLA